MIRRGSPNRRRHDLGGVIGVGVMIGVWANGHDTWMRQQGPWLHERSARAGGQGERTREHGARARGQDA